MQKWIFLMLSMTTQSAAQAQKCLVCDLQTRVPIRDVIMYTDNGFRSKTDYRGICKIPRTFGKATFTKPGYQQETLEIDEVLKDTVFLLSESHRLDEVEIVANHRMNKDSLNANHPQLDPLRDTGEGLKLGQGAFVFDFAKMIDRKHRRDMKALRKNREIFKQMDDEEDPVMRQYRETQRELELKKQREEAANKEKHE